MIVTVRCRESDSNGHDHGSGPHPAIDTHRAQTEVQRVYNQHVSTPQTMRTREEAARFSADLELAEPGLVQVHQWRPDPEDLAAAVTVSAYGAVGRKP